MRNSLKMPREGDIGTTQNKQFSSSEANRVKTLQSVEQASIRANGTKPATVRGELKLDHLTTFEGNPVDANQKRERSLAGGDDEAETPNSEASSAFMSGKSFWMRFLDDNHSEATDGSRLRKTPMGQEIHPTWSNGSPLSDCSVFQDTDDTPQSSARADEGEKASPRKVPDDRTRKSQLEQKKTENDENSEHGRASTGTFGETLSPFGLVRRSNAPPTPEFLPTGNATPRQFGDVTNRFKFFGNKGNDRKSIDGLKVTTTEEKVNSTESRRLISPLPDPMIEIGGSLHTPSPMSTEMDKMKIQKTPEKQEHYQSASDAWSKTRLMSKKAENRATSCHISRGTTYFHSYTPTPSSIQNQHQLKPVEMPENIKPDSASLHSEAEERVVLNSACSPELFDLPHQDIEPVPSGDSEGSGFRQLLKQWRTASDDKPNAHFLSPEHDPETPDSKLTNGLERGGFTPRLSQSNLFKENEEKNRETTIETPAVTKGIRAFDKDYFDLVREKNASSSGDEAPPRNHSLKSTTGQSSAEVSAKAVCFSNDEDKKTAAKMARKGTFVDSDVYEDETRRYEEPSRALVILENRETFEVLVGETQNGKAEQLVIRNVEVVTSDGQESRLTEHVPCECSQSVFSGNDDLISFFLPQMGMACSCGKQSRGLVNAEDPTAIENVLRPWQVAFLKSFGIHRGEQLVKARHRSGDVLAKALRQWRRKKGMAPFKTSSCGMAIHIWAKTCKAYVRSVRKQTNIDHCLLEQQPGEVVRELSHFLSDLPAAPIRRSGVSLLQIEPDSQMEI